MGGESLEDRIRTVEEFLRGLERSIHLGNPQEATEFNDGICYFLLDMFNDPLLQGDIKPKNYTNYLRVFTLIREYERIIKTQEGAKLNLEVDSDIFQKIKDFGKKILAYQQPRIEEVYLGTIVSTGNGSQLYIPNPRAPKEYVSAFNDSLTGNKLAKQIHFYLGGKTYTENFGKVSLNQGIVYEVYCICDYGDFFIRFEEKLAPTTNPEPPQVQIKQVTVQ